MRLTSLTDYGLPMRAASASDRAFSAAALADGYGLSRNHLAEIMQRLARAGCVATRRGGGAILAKPGHEIRLGALIRALEDGRPLVECFAADDGACIIHGRCCLKARLRSAKSAFMADMNRSTLADIALRHDAVT